MQEDRRAQNKQETKRKLEKKQGLEKNREQVRMQAGGGRGGGMFKQSGCN